MPGIKPGDSQQTVHIQVMNPNAMQATKFQMSQMSIPSIQSLQPNSTTVLTVAYNPTDGKLISNGFSQGMTVVAALQPQDLQILAHAQQQIQHQHHQFMHQENQDEPKVHSIESEIIKSSSHEKKIENSECEVHT